jgi:hypothetical protein
LDGDEMEVVVVGIGGEGVAIERWWGWELGEWELLERVLPLRGGRRRGDA